MSFHNASYAQVGQTATATAPASNGPGPQTSTGAQSYQKHPARGSSLEMPQLGATFVPGGFDDYYMPEVVAPAPQRVMPEVPQNMQDGLQRMELEAREIDASKLTNSTSPPVPGKHGREPSLSNVLANSSTPTPPANVPVHAPPTAVETLAPTFKAFQEPTPQPTTLASSFDEPSFSPFPKVKGDGVPPSDDEKEGILWNARQVVLHSNNIGMQLQWAKDALNWVDVVMEHQARELNGQPRPPTPKVEHELRVDALNIINYLASQEHPEALFMRSKWLEFGKFGYRADKKEAYQGYARAAKLGWGRAEYRMGMLYEMSNDFIKAVAHYGEGLKMKDSAASYRLGMMSLLGQHGQRKDFQRGIELIMAAADTADEDAPQGAYVYGMLIARDLPDISIPEGMLPYDLTLARGYIEKAAYLGFAKAQLKLGQAYELCQLGCDFEPAYSLHYYGLAAKQNQPEAALGVSRWFLFGYEGVFNKNEQLAFKYAQEAARAKLPAGEFAMGYYYEVGIHVEKDLREARNWYEKAAENGNKDAVGRLESLNQSKSLSKSDHETTALTRIKSQHGSQRGKRPDRFKQAAPMPTVTESEPATPVDKPAPSLPSKQATPKQSPNPSPRTNPTTVQDSVDFPDPSRLSLQGNRPPAFTINIDTQNAPQRPTSAAPYPDDDRPRPLNINRPKSTAPYPEDDVRPLSPHFNPSIRPSAGPIADRPSSAFGIRPPQQAGARQPSPGPRHAQSMATLGPPTAADSRGRVVSAGWEPQVPSAYRQPSPGPAGQGRGDYRRDEYRAEPQRSASAQPYPPDDRNPGGGPLIQHDPSGRNKLTKQNPYNLKPLPQPAGLPPPQFPMSTPGAGGSPVAQPGRDYGPRSSSRPASALPDQQPRPMSDNFDRYGRKDPSPRPVPGGRLPDRLDSLPSQQGHTHNRLPSQGSSYGAPTQVDRPGRIESAPPGPGGKPHSQQQPPRQRPSPSAASVASAPAANPAPPKKTGQGPSTFEEMGIQQGSDKDDCVVM